MQFKIEFTVRNLWLGDTTSLEFAFAGPRSVTVRLWHPTPDEKSAGHQADNSLGLVTGEREPNARVRAMFESLAQGKLPAGSTIVAHWVGVAVDEHGDLLPNHTAPFDMVPEAMQSFIRTITDELWDFARRTVRVLRWRTAAEGSHNPFSWRGAF